MAINYELPPRWFHAKAGSFRIARVYCVSSGFAWLEVGDGTASVALTWMEQVELRKYCSGVTSLDALEALNKEVK